MTKAKAFAILAADAVLFAGVSCVVGGVWWMHPPSGLVLLGLALATVAVLGVKACS